MSVRTTTTSNSPLTMSRMVVPARDEELTAAGDAVATTQQAKYQLCGRRLRRAGDDSTRQGPEADVGEATFQPYGTHEPSPPRDRWDGRL